MRLLALVTLMVLVVVALSGCTGAGDEAKATGIKPDQPGQGNTKTSAPATSSTATSATSTPPSTTSPTGATGQATLTVVDVGQGSAAVLQLPDAVLVYDAANRFASNYQPLLDTLTGLGVTTVTHFVLSHPDADHAGGCQHVFSVFEVHAFYHPGYDHTTQTWADCQAAASTEGATIQTDADLDPGDEIPLGASATMRVLYLDADAPDPNKASLSIRIDYGETSFLMVGDTDCGTEDVIIASGVDVDVDILEVGHHGSASSTCDAWLDATTPEVAYISAGSGNQYGHPISEVLGRLDAHSVPFYRTDVDGTITFTSDGITWSVTTGSASTTTTSPPTTTATGTTSPSWPVGIHIGEIMYDPPGDDTGTNLQNEYAELCSGNTSDDDLTGWILEDVAGNTYTLPAYTLAAGACVKIRTGSGTDSATDLHWGRGSAVWNNTGDTATLRDAAGGLVDEKIYP